MLVVFIITGKMTGDAISTGESQDVVCNRPCERAGHPMYFPVAGIEVNPIVPPLVAFVVSFFTSMGGVSGAFLLLPFQMSFLGYTTPSVSATNQLFNIVAIPSGVIRYIREGRMVWPLTVVVILGKIGRAHV